MQDPERRKCVQIDYRQGKPIYEQIIDEFRRLALLGAYKENEKLPSVREMASSLGVNPNTVAKSYQMMEQLGILYTIPGRGSFLSPRTDIEEARAEERRRELCSLWDSWIREGDGPEEIERFTVSVMNAWREERNVLSSKTLK